ncbi:hypothetical protein [Flagellimonas eckloniae]|uniref:Outer membrane protein beta-barrel domain-containing protein n=1 Tax=Flagellimonas eckloniae TaxID=346185 RepID=A0A0N8WFM3_9FLAO|nr:hypothetical protein [Allomuricauda eckloniae]KQC29099.1 hypothetical protein AAY42_03715 [Allomuricauda eckloniae]
MRRKLRLLLLCLFLFTVFSYGQIKSKKKTTNTELPESFLDRTEFKVGLVGTVFWSNGLSVGAEYLWKENEKTKTRNDKERTNTHQFLFNGNLGFVTNFSSKTDTGAYTNFGLTWRRTNKKGKQFNIELNPLGYYRSFLPETYEVNGDSVDKVFLPGRGYYAPSLSVGIGKHRKGKVRSGSYFNINYTLRTPYNSGALPTFSLQYGFRFNFKNKKQ